MLSAGAALPHTTTVTTDTVGNKLLGLGIVMVLKNTNSPYSSNDYMQ